MKTGFTAKEQTIIFNKIIELTNPYKAKQLEGGHSFDFDLNKKIKIYVTIGLIVNEFKLTEKNMPKPSDITVLFSSIVFYNKLCVNWLDNSNIEQRVKEYDWTKCF